VRRHCICDKEALAPPWTANEEKSMFSTRWRLFRLLGIPISVDASWLIILALLTLSFAGGFPEQLHKYYPSDHHPVAMYEFWIMGLVTALAFFVCLLLHELGHAVVARSRGMPIRGITLFLFGGVAEIEDEPPSAGTEFVMAIAGPVVTLILGIVFWILAEIGYNSGWPHLVVLVLGYLAAINGMVLVFNLIPAFPLDGGRVLRSILWGITGKVRRSTYWASLSGRGFAWVLIGLGVLQFFVHNEAGQTNWLGGVWLIFIGLFLHNAAQSGYRQVVIRQALAGEPVRRFMNPDPIVVPPAIDLEHWVEDYVYRFHHRAFPVTDNGRLEGIITTQALSEIPRGEWGRHTVGEVMTTDLEAVSIPATADAMEALGKMQRSGSSRLLVTEGGRLLGLISLKDLLRFLDTKLVLESEEEPPEDWHGPRERDESMAHHV
jgi:Zn-dependent protease/CBS domain-containing protein